MITKQLHINQNKKQDYVIGTNYISSNLTGFQNLSGLEKLKFLQKALIYNPYKKKYHKQYAELLQKIASNYNYTKNLTGFQNLSGLNGGLSIYKPAYTSPYNKKHEILNESAKHYNQYKELQKIDKFLSINKINHKSIIRHILITNTLGHFDLNKKGIPIINDFYNFCNKKKENRINTVKSIKQFSANPAQVFTKQASYYGKYTGLNNKNRLRYKANAAAVVAMFVIFSFLLNPTESKANNKNANTLQRNLQGFQNLEGLYLALNYINLDQIKTNYFGHDQINVKNNYYKNLTGFQNLSGLKSLKSNKNTSFFAIAFLLLILALYFARNGIASNFTGLNGKLLLMGFLGLLPYVLDAQTIATGEGMIYDSGFSAIANEPIQMWVADDSTNTNIAETSNAWGQYTFTIDLGPNNTEEVKENKPLANLISGGQDHTINFASKTQPEMVTVYDLRGRAINQIQAEWDGQDMASAYWDGTGQNGSEVSPGVYLISTNNGVTEKVVQSNNGNYFGNQGINALLEVLAKSPMNTKDMLLFNKEVVRLIEPSSIYLPFQDTVLMEGGYNFLSDIHLTKIPQHQDLTFKLRDGYTQTDLSGFIINIKNNLNMDPMGTAVTDANGNVTFQNVPADKTLYLEYGGIPSHFASKGNLWNMPEEIKFQQDTVASDTVKITLFPKALEIPARPGDPAYGTTVSPAAEEISELIRPVPDNRINAEETLRQTVKLYVNMTGVDLTNFMTRLEEGDSLFYGEETSPYIITHPGNGGTPFAIDEINLLNYDIYNNFNHPDTIGWNIIKAGNNTDTRGINQYNNNINNENNDIFNVLLGGAIEVSLSQAEFYKEIYGRRTGKDNDVDPGWMNTTPSMPTLEDRAIFKVINQNHTNRLLYKIDYFSLENTTDTL